MDEGLLFDLCFLGSDDEFIFNKNEEEMQEAILLENCGCIVIIEYDYHPLVQALIDARDAAGLPLPPGIYKSWDVYTRAILALQKQTYFIRFEITGTDEDPTLVYNKEELIDADILDVAIEGQGIDESDPAKVTINTTTGDVTFGNVTTGQYVKITYKK